MEVVFHHRELGFSGKKILPLIFITFLLLNFNTFSQSDACATAPTINLTAGTLTTAGSNVGFGVSASEPTVRPCNGSGGAGSLQCAGWYILHTDANGGNLTASLTLGTITWSALTLYSLPGSCTSFSTNPASIACSDPNSGAGVVPSFITTCLAPNTNYYLMVWTDGSHAGTFTLNTTYTPSGNDACASAASLLTGATIGENNCATYTSATDQTVTCQSNSAKYGYTVWYKYNPGATGGNVTISLASGTIKFASLALYSGTCGAFTELDCMDQFTVTAASPSVSAACLLANTDYYLMVWCDGAVAAGYGGTYTLTTTASASPGGNDCCANATAIAMNVTATIGSYTGTVVGDNSTATADGSSYCYTINKNLWYTFVAPVTASYYCGIVAGTIVDPEISVSTGSCGALTEASCAGENAGVIYDAYHSSTVAQGSYTLAYAPFSIYSAGYTYGAVCSVIAGTTVHVMVDNYSAGSAGTYTLTIANLKNDDIAQPLLINDCGSVFNGTTIGATNCGSGIGDGYFNNLDNNTATACDGSAGVTSCGNAGGPGNHAYNNIGCAAPQCDANLNGGDIGFTPENDSWYEFCVVSNCTVTITFNVTGASCLVPTGGTTALQLAAFTGASNNLTKIFGGYFLQSITSTATFSFAAAANTCYFFEVDGYSGTNCNYTLQADIIPTCVLPVKLLYFTGTNEQGKIKLDWTSAEESNSGKYIIERSDNGVDYVPIITKKAKGNTTEQTNYTAYDESPLINKINYYRLSEYDLNGKGGLLSQTFVSNTAGFPKFSVYPNPSNGTLNIKLHNFGVSSVFVEIVDLLGNSVWSSNIDLTEGNGLHQLDLSMLENGVYFVRTSDGETFYKQQLMISK